MENIKYYAFLDRIDPGPVLDAREPKRIRTNYLFDAIRKNNFDHSQFDGVQAMPLIRMMTTSGIFSEMAQGHEPKEGDWYEIEIGNAANPRPWVWTADLKRSDEVFFENDQIMRLRSIRYLSSDQSRVRSPKTDSNDFTLATNLKNKYKIKATYFPSVQTLDRNLVEFGKKRPTSIQALDVGQASMIAIFQDDEVIAFYDTGWPLWFNSTSIPANNDTLENLNISPYCVVFLSHWDYDHFYWAQFHSNLQKYTWIAPATAIGPNTMRFCSKLGHHLHAVERKTGQILNFGCVDLEWGLGSDRNNSGLIAHIKIGGKKILLTGDASYEHIPKHLQEKLTSITIPHHGSAISSGCVPSPNPLSDNSKAVACAGMENKYGHPSKAILKAHEDAGWKTVETTGEDYRATKRGTRILFP